MQIGKPVAKVPARKRAGVPTKYRRIWVAARGCSPRWLPVRVKTTKEARQLQSAARSHRDMTVTVRGLRAYVRYRRTVAE